MKGYKITYDSIEKLLTYKEHEEINVEEIKYIGHKVSTENISDIEKIQIAQTLSVIAEIDNTIKDVQSKGKRLKDKVTNFEEKLNSFVYRNYLNLILLIPNWIYILGISAIFITNSTYLYYYKIFQYVCMALSLYVTYSMLYFIIKKGRAGLKLSKLQLDIIDKNIHLINLFTLRQGFGGTKELSNFLVMVKLNNDEFYLTYADLSKKLVYLHQDYIENTEKIYAMQRIGVTMKRTVDSNVYFRVSELELNKTKNLESVEV